MPPRGLGRFCVGDRVRSLHGFPGAIGEIVEDRGPIGHRGWYYYHIRFLDENGEEMRLDWPEDELVPVDGKREPGNSPPPVTPHGAASG
jgi:hypothetical protein